MIGFIGGGNMAEAILAGLGPKAREVGVSDVRTERLKYLEDAYGVKTFKDNKSLVKASKAVVLAVKPQQLSEVLKEVSSLLKSKLVVSIAAGVALEYLMQTIGHKRVIRAMPNTAALVRQSITVLSPGPKATEQDITLTKDLFGAVGQVMVLKESLMDAVTAVSGSGPAFVAYLIQAMVEAAVREGLPVDQAEALVLQTVEGTVKLINSGYPSHEVIRMVSSPGGTTVEGLYVLDQGRIRATLKRAIRAAREKAEQLRRQ